MCLAVPGRVLSIVENDSLWRRGRVDFAGVVKEASLACVPEAETGDYVIVHAGVAIQRIDVEDAARMLEDLRAMEPQNGRDTDPDEVPR